VEATTEGVMTELARELLETLSPRLVATYRAAEKIANRGGVPGSHELARELRTTVPMAIHQRRRLMEAGAWKWGSNAPPEPRKPLKPKGRKPKGRKPATPSPEQRRKLVDREARAVIEQQRKAREQMAREAPPEDVAGSPERDPSPRTSHLLAEWKRMRRAQA
jgi:hypothetical protein